jgi:hypothetical protein
MIKKTNFILGMLFFSYFAGVNAQVLEVKEIFQEQEYWCWAGTSACILDYYNKPVAQCTIAEFARKNSKEIDFGTSDCCTEPGGKCNHWNYLFQYDGSIENILDHFGKIPSTTFGQLSKSTIASEIAGKRPFIFRWQWNNKSGHFLVGYGLVNNKFYYMNPGENQGKEIADYDWVIKNADHLWTHTLVLSDITGSPDLLSTSRPFIYPNPASGKISFKEMPNSTGTMIEISSSSGNICYSKPFPVSGELDLSGLPRGIYILRMITRDQVLSTKLVLN